MSQETPRSSAGVSTPRTYTEIYNNLDIFKETDYQKSLSKSIHNNLKDWPHEIPERGSSCGDFGAFLEKKSDILLDKNSCAESEWNFSHKLENLGKKLARESHIRNQQTRIITELEFETQERLTLKNKYIENLKQEKRQTEAECAKLKDQLEITSRHLDNLGTSFNDVHMKYEKAKQTIQILQRNVEILKESISEHEGCIRQKHSQYLQLKEHAIERLNYANVQLDLMERKFSLEVSKLRATVNESELHVRTLSEKLKRKNRENTELISICEGLISRMDHTANISIKNIMDDFGKELVNLSDKNKNIS